MDLSFGGHRASVAHVVLQQGRAESAGLGLADADLEKSRAPPRQTPEPLLSRRRAYEGPINRLFFTDCYCFCPTFLGDFSLQKLPSRRLRTLWEQKNRVLLEEYYIFNAAIPISYTVSILSLYFLYIFSIKTAIRKSSENLEDRESGKEKGGGPRY